MSITTGVNPRPHRIQGLQMQFLDKDDKSIFTREAHMRLPLEVDVLVSEQFCPAGYLDGLEETNGTEIDINGLNEVYDDKMQAIRCFKGKILIVDGDKRVTRNATIGVTKINNVVRFDAMRTHINLSSSHGIISLT